MGTNLNVNQNGTLYYWVTFKESAGVTLALDHFLCYKAKTAKGAPKFVSFFEVSLEDQFEDKLFDVKKVKGLCNPADKNDEGILDPITHLESYQIKLTKTDPKQPKHERQKQIQVVNPLHQPGELIVDTVKPDLLLVPTAKCIDDPPGTCPENLPAPDPGAHNVDHFKCYKIKISKGAPKFPKGLQVSVEDQFHQAKLYDVKKPKHLCPPVNKEGEGFQDEAAHLMCYQVKAVKGEPKTDKVLDIHVSNQFGEGRLDAIKEDVLCVPSLTTIQ